jgi:uncharacterized protein (TIGR00255 family)
MTAFARESVATDEGSLTVELRSVNHRYLDCSFKLPDILRELEPKLREQAGKTLARGKLDCALRLQASPEQQPALRIDNDQLARLLDATSVIEAQMSTARPMSPLEVLQFPGIWKPPEYSEEQLQATAAELFGRALANLRTTREREGSKLAVMIADRLEQVSASVVAIRARMPELMQQQRDRILTRIRELDIELDHNRLEQELVHLAQKADIDEELDRLDAHISEVHRTLDKGGPCGRRLDFLMQELNREANTLSSKSFSSSTTQTAVDLKVLIEQMREQIQNIE